MTWSSMTSHEGSLDFVSSAGFLQGYVLRSTLTGVLVAQE